MNLVVDASTAIKWFIHEPLHAEALRLLDRPDALSAPDLLAAEVTNIAWKKVVRGEIDKDQATEIAGSIRRGTPLLYPSSLFNERALELALTLGHSVYDCLYLACAESVDAILITADERFCRKAQSGGFVHRIELLSANNPFWFLTVTESAIEEIKQAALKFCQTSQHIDKKSRNPGQKRIRFVSSKSEEVSMYLESPARIRLFKLIHDLPLDERADVIALAWLGREGGSWERVRKRAADAVQSDIDYTIGYGLDEEIEAGLTLLRERAGSLLP